MNKYDPHESGVQYLEDMATAYWSSQALFTAVEMEIFDIIEQWDTLDAITISLECDKKSLQRFLDALIAMGLISVFGDHYYNTEVSKKYLLKTNKNYQGNSILWRRDLMNSWEDLKHTIQKGRRINYVSDDQDISTRTTYYIKGMDDIAKYKAQQMLPFFNNISLSGDILDVGAGSGAVSQAFINVFKNTKATLFDLDHVINISKDTIGDNHTNYLFYSGNVLDDWRLDKKYDLIILSNILHAYADDEVRGIIAQASKYVEPTGYILIHDFFMEHYRIKPQLFDLNMLINTYNGKVFHASWVKKLLEEYQLYHTGLLPLESDTGIIIASKSKNELDKLSVDKVDQIIGQMDQWSFKQGIKIHPQNVVLSPITLIQCQYGCEYYGKGKCPPNAMGINDTKELLHEYTLAILIEGEPPTREFQQKLLELEKHAFKKGYYKAMIFWAGPCSLCDECLNTKDCSQSRPSMEGCGIDVFETVKRMGITLKTLNEQKYIKYFALLLLE